MKPLYLLAAILCVLLLYALSYGPVISAAELYPHYYFAVEKFYAPLFSIPGAKKPLEWYRSSSASVVHPDLVVTYGVWAPDQVDTFPDTSLDGTPAEESAPHPEGSPSAK